MNFFTSKHFVFHLTRSLRIFNKEGKVCTASGVLIIYQNVPLFKKSIFKVIGNCHIVNKGFVTPERFGHLISVKRCRT